ncbi:MmyB family transcriptional regulator [Streptomyces sp. NPDC001415]
MSAVRDMVGQVLAAHEPYPAVVLDRYWNRVDANEPARLLRVSLHPDGMAPRIGNLGEWREAI